MYTTLNHDERRCDKFGAVKPQMYSVWSDSIRVYLSPCVKNVIGTQNKVV